jgi:hypothetical protein
MCVCVYIQTCICLGTAGQQQMTDIIFRYVFMHLCVCVCVYMDMYVVGSCRFYYSIIMNAHVP